MQLCAAGCVAGGAADRSDKPPTARAFWLWKWNGNATLANISQRPCPYAESPTHALDAKLLEPV
eukprot:CAMPEP_0195099956 /NCGR_PEP_ID=MMETSP0448-20130528/60469_1 /TAXON_ID=66468 /ORGANISM="Heterocapsa triquestra, Strain CCMP 448" /LENGTH=63 /DNA_ID=CAMNT_0040134979 /DNA_START=24 /DNA_END=211 /DNA_ORIENTATION=-